MSALLVTGGAGFIGSRVVAAALAGGHDVRVLDSISPHVHREPPVLPDRVELIRAEIADPDALATALDGIDAVCHLAAKVGMETGFDDAPDYTRDNVVGTAALLRAMAAAGTPRLVLSSSMVVYGEGRYVDAAGRDRVPAPRRDADLRAGMFEPRDAENGEVLHPALVGEDAPIDPRSVYAITKLAQEQLAAAWSRETGGAVAALRYHNVYGPGMPRDTPYAGVAAIFRSALERGEAPQVFEDGGQRRDFIHVDDVATANLAALEWTGRERGIRPFNVGSGTVSTVLDIARALAAAAGGPDPVVTGRFRAADVRHITASSERAHAELGWSARIGLEEGMRELATAPLRR